MFNRTAAETGWSPLYFLSALGAGGLAVTFFMFLMFWVPHPAQPVPVFADIIATFQAGSILQRGMIALALAGIAGFATLHYGLLVWNLRMLARFRQTGSTARLIGTNAETQLSAVPLSLAMGVNVGFILGLVFVPGLWSVVEFLFPMAIATFLGIGIYAFGTTGRFLGRVMAQGGFAEDQNASFAQLLPAFSFAMVGVGLAAPAAMSGNGATVALAMSLSTVFGTAAVLWTVAAMVLALRSIVTQGAAPEAAPTLMVLVPILTVLGIAALRMDHGLHTRFDAHQSNAETMIFLTRIIAAQILILLIGVVVLRAQGYAQHFLSLSGQRSAGSYALVCPGVALSVMWHFWVNKGLVGSGVIEKFSTAYWLATAPALAVQIAMIALVVWLHRLHFTRRGPAIGVPAE